MAVKKYRVDTDKGSYEIEVDEPTPAGESMVGARGRLNTQETPMGESAHEPDTWWGGFMADINKQMHEMGDSMLGGAAQPQTTADFLGLLLPNVVAGQGRSVSAQAANELPGRSKQAFKGAAAKTNMSGGLASDVKEIATFPLKSYKEFKDALPSNSAKASREFRGPREAPAPKRPVNVQPNKPDLIDKYLKKGPEVETDRYMANTGVDINTGGPQGAENLYKRRGVTRGEPPMDEIPASGVPAPLQTERVPYGQPTPRAETEVPIDRYMPNSTGGSGAGSGASTSRVPYGQPSAPVNTNTVPIESGTIDDMLQELMQADAPVDPRITGIAPEAEVVGGGPIRQSGTFDPEESLGQAGGYSSGNPGSRNAGTPVTDSQYGNLMERFGGRGGVGADAAPTPAGGIPVSDATSTIDDFMDQQYNPGAMADQAQELRRNVGSRDAAREMFGTANPETQHAIRTMSPGPSQIPLTAEDRIRKAAEEVIRQMGIGGERR